MIDCKYCGSASVILKGNRNTKRGHVQRYKCRSCTRKFIKDALRHKQVSLASLSKIFQWAVDNKTYREIGLEIGVSSQTVSSLIKDYVRLFLEYESKLDLKIGGNWQMDDVYHELRSDWTKFYGLNPKKEGGLMRLRVRKEIWVLNVMDEDTRYWLAANASARNKFAAIKALSDALNRAKHPPERIKGDDCPSYPPACNAILPRNIARDFKSKKEAFSHINTVERLNRTLRKSLPSRRRRFRSKKDLQNFLELVRFHYNYIRGHEGLNKKTPAEIAGVPSLSEDRWQNLVNLAYDNSSRLEKTHEPHSLIASFEPNMKLSRQTNIINSCWQRPAA